MQRGLVGSEMCIRDRSTWVRSLNLLANPVTDAAGGSMKKEMLIVFDVMKLKRINKEDVTAEDIKEAADEKKERERQAEEARLEAERLAKEKEEQEKKEREEAEEKEREEAEAKAKEEAEAKAKEEAEAKACLLYTSDAADDTPCVDLGGRRIIKKKKQLTSGLKTSKDYRMTPSQGSRYRELA
eukprot:TRINITY_DN8938_c0_g1_i2.p3 TRINITY_DN8938_c0_g1~~TRINITY_DN8938_c0_g1_i2.p3  ORF type:complete len:184 (+),score=79.14 TRINITY_DN8938_c0_g1_i2:153-704(+)